MFTGIIQAVGKIAKIQKFSQDTRIDINVGDLNVDDVKLGDSIAVNGACLTVVNLHKPCFSVDASAHTLEKTTLGNLREGMTVNLEKCLQLQSYIGGHLVTGHVDGIATLIEKKEVGRAQEMVWKIPQAFVNYVAQKGSIALDGISLTVNAIEEDRVFVTIIPHTLERTTLDNIQVGEKANVEVDLIARYAARWINKQE